MRAVIVAAERQMVEVNRLQKYCRELDGTELVVLPAVETGLPYPHRNNSAFHQAAVAMKGSPFIWLEPDSIPLKAGWRAALQEAWLDRRVGTEFLISGDTNPPHDMVGGIGVYGADTHWLIPEHISGGAGFDGWMLRHLGPLVERTPLIQHSYGVYDQAGNMLRRHTFPADRGMIRPDAVIFHADPRQTLIPRQPSDNAFIHPGDLGDALSCLPVVRQLGGGRLIFRDHPESRTTRFYRSIRDRWPVLAPLLEAQPYIDNVCYDEEEKADYDFTYFRANYEPTKSLVEAHADFLGVDNVDMSPWLQVEPSEKSKGRTIVARSPRYHNAKFPWQDLLEKAGDSALFVGLPEEHSMFEQEMGRKVEYAPTKDFLELAQLIAGSDLFIGNQSAPCWVALGLGHPLIQETSDWNPDSIIARPNAQFIW